MLKRIFSLLLAVLLCLGAAGCGTADTTSKPDETPELSVDISGNVKGSAVVEREYTTLCSDNDDLMYNNPNRGLRGYFDFFNFEVSNDELLKRMQEQRKELDKFAQSTTYVCYFYPAAYRGKHLPDRFFEAIQYIFDYLREEKIQILLRFAYFDVNNYNDRTPLTEELMIHINDLIDSGIIEKNKDVIHVFQAGFVGKFGEWHSDEPKADRNLILNTLVDKLIPKDLYIQVRQPDYKDFVADGHPAKSRIGFNNDAWFGIQDSTELGNQNYSYGLEPWNRHVKEGAYTPNDAELYFWNQFENEVGFYPDGYACLLGASQLRFTTLSAINGWLDHGALRDGAMVRWQSQPVNEKWLKEYGIPYSENWFKNSDGETVERNVFEFHRDYVGYRITATELSVKNKGKKDITATLKLENHGFSAAFNITSSLVILNSKGEVVSSAAAGNPADWHSTNPDDYKDRKQLVHTVSADLPLPDTKGEYKIALQLLSKGGGTARLDNNIPYEDGYNILHTFSVN